MTSLAWGAWEITPFAGGRIGGALNVDDATYNRLEFKDAPTYGLAIGADLNDESALEVLWSHQETTLKGRQSADGMKVDVTQLGADQVFLNGLYYLAEGKLRPFALGGLGVSMWNPYGNYDSVTQFAWALGGGMKYYLTKQLGLRFDARWVPTVLSSDSSVFCRSDLGGQCTVRSGGTLIDQFEFTGGLVLRFGHQD
jgi:hypothetical protein